MGKSNPDLAAVDSIEVILAKGLSPESRYILDELFRRAFQAGKRIARKGYKTRQDAFVAYGYKRVKQTILARKDGGCTAFSHMRGCLSDAILIEEIPPFGNNEDRHKLFLERYLKIDRTPPWISLYDCVARYEHGNTKREYHFKA